MGFMRLGTRVAVINDLGEILLSKRGDFGTWSLPGGRIDRGELAYESAIREVEEETGLIVSVDRPVGLYFQQGRSRMNILYRAKPVGGTLLDHTDETLANCFFSPQNLPQPLFGQHYIDHAYRTRTYLYTEKTPRWQLVQLEMKLRWRWIKNLLSGRLEPKFVPFSVRAVGLLWNDDKTLVYAEQGELPNYISDGNRALPVLLNTMLHGQFAWEWSGLWQNTTDNMMDVVLSAHVENAQKQITWSSPDHFPLRHKQYLELDQKRIHDRVWLLSDD